MLAIGRSFKAIVFVLQILCNFGSKDKTNILLADMQKLLFSTQHKRMQMKRNDTNTKKMGRKSLSEFPKSNQHSQPKFRIGKTMSSMSIK